MTTISPEVWRRAESLFAAATALPVRERSVWLQHACGNDEEARAAVEDLLVRDEKDCSLLDSPLTRADPIAAASAGSKWLGRGLGPYRILRQIGRGGMSHIYLAEREDEIEQQVAIKLLDKVDNSTLLRLFRRERRILARLEHPNIARFFDGGTTEEGVPYVVMEHVEGVLLTEFCDTRRLDLRQRLELFLKICAAVQYAHQNLVVHRDLKPSNILVTDHGEPKLLDFGIAKLFELTAAERQEVTATQERFLTPSYASPEQLSGRPITTAADVYALGVILYELLTGLLPHDLQRVCAVEAIQLLEHGPDLPSKVAAAVSASESRGAPERGISWARRLRGDLDTIILLCLRFEARDRYSSVERLAADLQRYLQGLPVLARRPSLAYRLGKLARRNPVAVTTSAVAAVLFAALVVLLVLHAERVARERDLALRAQTEAERISRFLGDAFRLADPFRKADLGKLARDEVTAREVLELSAEQVERELVAQPLVQARLMDTLAETFNHLGRPEEAVVLFGKALRVKRRQSAQAAEIVASLNGFGSALINNGQLDKARAVLREAVMLGRLHGEATEPLADSLMHLGHLLFEQSDIVSAESHLREALAIRRQLGDSESRFLAKVLIYLGGVLLFQRDIEAAEPLLHEALAILHRLPGGEHPDHAAAFHFLGSAKALQRQPRAAERYLRRALALRRQLHGPEHPDTLTSLASLGEFLLTYSDYDAAETILREVLELDRKIKGEDHPHVAIDLQSLAVISWQRGDLSAAESQMRQAWELARVVWGPENRATLSYLQQIGELRLEQGDLGEAERILRQVFERQSSVLAPEDRHLGWTSVVLADLFVSLGRFDEAVARVEEGLRIISSNFAEDNWRVGVAKSVLGASLAGQGAVPEAEALLREGLTRLEAWQHRGYMARHLRLAELRLDRFKVGFGLPAESATIRSSP